VTSLQIRFCFLHPETALRHRKRGNDAGFTANAENADEQAVVIFPVFPMPAEFSLSFAARTDQPRDKSLAVMVE